MRNGEIKNYKGLHEKLREQAIKADEKFAQEK